MATLGTARYVVTADAKGVAGGTRKIRAELAQQNRAITRAIRKWDQFNTRLNLAAKSMTRVTRLLSISSVSFGAIGAAAFGAAIKGASDFGAKLAENADALGVTAEELQKIQQAFESDGLSPEAAIKGFKRLSNAISQAQFGLVSYTRIFDTLGLDADRLAALSPTAQFSAVFNALASPNITTTQRGDFTQDLFGGRGGGFLTLASEQGRFDRNLAGIEGLSRVSQETADNLKEMNQEIFNLTENLKKGFYQEVIGRNAEVLTAALERLTTKAPPLMEKLGNITETLVNNAGKIKDVFVSVLLAAGVIRVVGGAGAAIRGADTLVSGVQAFRARRALQASGLIQAAGSTGFTGALSGAASLVNPIGAAVAALGALTVAAYAGAKALDARREGQARTAANEEVDRILRESSSSREALAELAAARLRVRGDILGLEAAQSRLRMQEGSSPEEFVENRNALLSARASLDVFDMALKSARERVEADRLDAEQIRANTEARKAEVEKELAAKAAARAAEEAAAQAARDLAQRLVEVRSAATLLPWGQSDRLPGGLDALGGGIEIGGLGNRRNVRLSDVPSTEALEQARGWYGEWARQHEENARIIELSNEAETRQLTGMEKATSSLYLATSALGLLRDVTGGTSAALDKFIKALTVAQATLSIIDLAKKLIPGFATGGYAGPGAFIAGEAGAELISTRRQVYVHNPAETRQLLGGAGGGDSPSYNFNIRIGGGSAMDRRRLRETVVSTMKEVTRAPRSDMRFASQGRY